MPLLDSSWDTDNGWWKGDPSESREIRSIQGYLIFLLKGPIKWIESNHKIDGVERSDSNKKINVDFTMELKHFRNRKIGTTDGPHNPFKGNIIVELSGHLNKTFANITFGLVIELDYCKKTLKLV